MKISNSDRRRPFRNRRRGVTIAESAVVLSVWLLVVFVGLDWGVAVFRHNTLAEAARRLARAAIVHGSKASPEMSVWGPATFNGTADDDSEASQVVRPILAMMSPGDVSIEIVWLDDANDPDDRVSVTLTFEHRSLAPHTAMSAPMRLRGSSIMRIVH